MIERHEEFLRICSGVRAALQSKASWEVIYDFVFSNEISGRIHELGFDIECSYPGGDEDDVQAYADELFDLEKDIRELVLSLRYVERQ